MMLKFDGRVNMRFIPFALDLNFLFFSLVTSMQAKVRDLVSCKNWYPLYEVMVRDGICYNGTYGLAWGA